MPLVAQREVSCIAKFAVDDGRVHAASCSGRVADSGDSVVELAKDGLDYDGGNSP